MARQGTGVGGEAGQQRADRLVVGVRPEQPAEAQPLGQYGGRVLLRRQVVPGQRVGGVGDVRDVPGEPGQQLGVGHLAVVLVGVLHQVERDDRCHGEAAFRQPLGDLQREDPAHRPAGDPYLRARGVVGDRVGVQIRELVETERGAQAVGDLDAGHRHAEELRQAAVADDVAAHRVDPVRGGAGPFGADRHQRRALRPPVADRPGHGGDRGVGEQHRQRERRSQGGPDPGHQLHTEQGVPAERD
ncbi:hypothetical protein SDIAM103S_05729 [Streptomyces diastaticus subsp. diastaticus]